MSPGASRILYGVEGINLDAVSVGEIKGGKIGCEKVRTLCGNGESI